MAPTCSVPNMSRRYAGMVANPPPYMLRITQNVATNSTRFPARANDGTSAYSTIPTPR